MRLGTEAKAGWGHREGSNRHPGLTEQHEKGVRREWLVAGACDGKFCGLPCGLEGKC